MFFGYAGAVLLIRMLGARLPDRLGWRVASSIALVSRGASAALLVAAWASSAAVWIAAAFFAIGMSLLFPALFSAVVADVPEDQRSQAVGTFSLFFDLANGLGAPFLGLVVALTLVPRRLLRVGGDRRLRLPRPGRALQRRRALAAQS